MEIINLRLTRGPAGDGWTGLLSIPEGLFLVTRALDFVGLDGRYYVTVQRDAGRPIPIVTSHMTVNDDVAARIDIEVARCMVQEDLDAKARAHWAACDRARALAGIGEVIARCARINVTRRSRRARHIGPSL